MRISIPCSSDIFTLVFGDNCLLAALRFPLLLLLLVSFPRLVASTALLLVEQHKSGNLKKKRKLDLLGKTLEINPAGVGCQRKSTKLLSVRIRVRRFVCLRSDFRKRHMSLKIQGVQKEDKVGHSGSDGLMKN